MAVLKKISFVFLAFILIGGTFFAGFYIGNSFGLSQCKICPPEEIDFSLFWETYHKIQDKFVNRDKIDKQQIIYGAISGMVKALNDPYTVFFPPEDSKIFQEDVKGSFEGVGMEIGIRDNQLQVISPLEGTPAERAGIRAGDIIVAVNGTSTAGIALEKAVKWIRGPKGSEVTLTIMREGWKEAKEIKIVRDTISIPAVRWELKENNIAYLKIYQFSGNAAFEFSKAAVEILNSPAEKIIIDLRNNPGGYLEVVQDIAGWFLKKDELVAIEDFGPNQEKTEYRSKGKGNFSNYPVVILINQGSASASEILAGALRDNLGIKLIGERSFGKGSVQTLEQLRDGSSVKITVAKWLTPKGESISEKGLEPDIKLEMTEQDYESGKDPQLDKAIEIIKGM
ncbi:MAG TPA: S41 family peptidase [Candidatus Parcubacteria bacterium]|nr:S41 family peptidase [Candidatus Parcubacteria bacterium]